MQADAGCVCINAIKIVVNATNTSNSRTFILVVVVLLSEMNRLSLEKNEREKNV